MNKSDRWAHITGTNVTEINAPQPSDSPGRPLGKPADVHMPRGITVTGSNVPASSRPVVNRTLDQETARVITRGRARPNPTPDHDTGEIDTEIVTYEEAAAALKAKYGMA